MVRRLVDVALLLALVSPACGSTREAESGPAHEPRGTRARARQRATTREARRDGAATTPAAEAGHAEARGTAPDSAAPVPRTLSPSPPVQPESDPFASLRACRDGRRVWVTVSPRRPTTADPLRIVAVSDDPLEGAQLVARGPDGMVALGQTRWGGPPWALAAEVEQPGVGDWQVGVVDGDAVLACRRARVRTRSIGLGSSEGLWTAERGWDRGTENLYSAWIEHLFDAPGDRAVGWRPLHELTRDRERNLLHDHLGLGEDDPERSGALSLTADCADVPYFLRAYFAWKLRLPFQWSRCEAESSWRAPVCRERFDNTVARSERGELPSFQAFLARLADTVHSGNMRALPTDELADFYPVTLTRESLRPGTVFANPYGHVMVVSRWQPQRPDAPGVLFAIDGNPDRSIGRKRFWRGAFAFGAPVWAGAAGFKAFRPIVSRNGGFEALSNRQINAYGAYGNYSHEQYRHGTDAFYARVESLINPTPLPPERAFEEMFGALVEMLQARVRAVSLGAAWTAEHPDPPIPMPDGPQIFETTGPWEDWSTPSRDMSLLGALDLVRDLPASVEQHPTRFGVAPGEAAQAARARVQELLTARLQAESITYRRSDGSDRQLSVAEVIERSEALEMAYNPNDCPEVRWGAPEGSAEHSTCRRRAPADQLERMLQVRVWFHSRTRPRRI